VPIPSYTGLQTALSGLQAAQAAIDTTGQNIANADTPGYSRQTVNLTERNALTIPSLSSITSNWEQLGTGVDITNISRVRDQFLDAQYRAQNSATSSLSSQSTILGQAQATLNEPSTSGLSASLQNFWSAFNSLSTAPNNLGAQQTVLSDGAAVAKTLNTLSGQITSLQSQVTQQYDALTNAGTGPIASDAQQIASLNQSIAQAQAVGQADNGLLDQRDKLVDDLSQYSNVSVSTQPNGMVNVSFGNAAIAAGHGTADATPLVSGGNVNLSANLTDQNLSGSGGQLGALLGLYDATSGTGQLQNYITGPGGLDAVAGALTSTVNGAIAGADSSGPSATAFFTGTTAATIAVNPSITTSTTNPPYTAAEASAVNGLSGGTADQTYNAFVAKVGADVQSVQNGQQTGQVLLTAISNQRQSVSGVSLDEEMTNLISEQQAYQACARVMNAIDSTLNTLITQVGSGL
jgi:flagellar hook-associated protein 1 FlgK